MEKKELGRSHAHVQFTDVPPTSVVQCFVQVLCMIDRILGFGRMVFEDCDWNMF